MVFDNSITLEPLKCLRTDYMYNECSKCIDTCPVDALSLTNIKRINLDNELCTKCGGCIGVCPTQSFLNESFNPSHFVLESNKSQDITLSCTNNIPCLAYFDSQLLISLGLRHKTVLCDTSLCKDCDLNTNDKLSSQINKNINESQVFLELIGLKSLQIASTQTTKTNRRDAITKFTKEIQSLKESENFDAVFENKESLTQPRVLLQNSIKYAIENLNTTTLQAPLSFIANQKIDFFLCNNCGDCVQFCPTKALTYSSDETKIIFQMAQCVHCNICHDICKQKAFSNDETFDLVTLAFNRAEIIIENNFQICCECKVSFPQKTNETICKRCEDFASNHANLFVLAKDTQ